MTSPRYDGDGRRFVGALFDWLTVAGATRYDSAVTQLEHGLQSAALARAQGGDDALVTACLLHDVGHLLADEHDGHGDFLDRDLRHEAIGAGWLGRAFGPEVTEPIRLHVAAKRYLCSTDADYHSGLSESSKRSFVVQGGLLAPAEAAAFAGLPNAATAVAVRRIDDLAKVGGALTPPLADFTGAVIACLTTSHGARSDAA